MSKPLAGKRAFEALGRSHAARGLEMNMRMKNKFAWHQWPIWARKAYCLGYEMQQHFWKVQQ